MINVVDAGVLTGQPLSYNTLGTTFRVNWAQGCSSAALGPNMCSALKPRWCPIDSIGTTLLRNRASVCGCPANYEPSGDNCNYCDDPCDACSSDETCTWSGDRCNAVPTCTPDSGPSCTCQQSNGDTAFCYYDSLGRCQGTGVSCSDSCTGGSTPPSGDCSDDGECSHLRYTDYECNGEVSEKVVTDGICNTNTLTCTDGGYIIIADSDSRDCNAETCVIISSGNINKVCVEDDRRCVCL